jgi:large subunit ribosomal protein L3
MFKMGLLGKKIGMTQVFTDEGFRLPVTAVETGPCVVLAKRTPDKDGYAALQLGFDDQKPSRVNQPDLGRFAKVDADPKRFVREIRLPQEALDRFEVGQEVKLSDVFAEGDVVDVTGVSRGKGFQGVMKIYHFAGARASHGVHEFFRHGGSIGCRLTPGRVVKGKKMARHLGNKKVTVQNLRVVQVREEDNVLLVKGAVPGGQNGYLVIHYAQKKPLPERVQA